MEIVFPAFLLTMPIGAILFVIVWLPTRGLKLHRTGFSGS
jgi:hypothetical protein